MAGRRPKPTAIKELAGNPGKRAMPKDEPKLAVRIPTPPAWLQGEARKEYRRTAKLLAEMRVLTEADRVALVMYAQQYDRWVEAEAKVRELGVIVKAPGGFPIQNPYLSIANQSLKALRSLLIEFGMTPASRTRVQAQTEDEGDEFDRFLRGAG